MRKLAWRKEASTFYINLHSVMLTNPTVLTELIYMRRRGGGEDKHIVKYNIKNYNQICMVYYIWDILFTISLIFRQKEGFIFFPPDFLLWLSSIDACLNTLPSLPLSSPAFLPHTSSPPSILFCILTSPSSAAPKNRFPWAYSALISLICIHPPLPHAFASE